MSDDERGITRRDFLERTGAAGLGVALGGVLPVASRREQPGRSANETVVVAVIGRNGRGMVHAQNFARLPNAQVAYLCDVDGAVLRKAAGAIRQSRTAVAIEDFRRALDDKAVDAVSIATPDHWHTAMAILALKAGKHVYLEKPCGHNAREGELLTAAAKKYDRHVQQGSQQRSAARTIEALQMVREGAIGAPYLVRAWYANSRGGIGHGRPAPVPSTLNYELWQGPAPRTPYRDNVVHYNWHWFKRWGTGEICNNGTHEIDIARLALGVDYPTSVTSSGGRYHFQDDWEFPDTQDVTFEFAGGKRILWQGQSCNALKPFDRGRGTAIYGTGGSMVLDRDGYLQYDLKQKLVKESLEPKQGNGVDLIGDDAATWQHMENFLGAIRTGETLRAPITDGARSVHLCHLGNIAQYTGRALRIDPANGHIMGDTEAMRHWSRSYAPGWAPTA
ncbi:MAG TPA: Gfo/Idh/MocA family oxidoreductase [Gemmatimonadaceae bacterium]|nr:Gfo/Idh/MocA family oxidoreductase [Gemmatimonadaceae bacterium]